MKLKISTEKVLNEFENIGHKNFHKGLINHWNPESNGTIKANDVLWLFCWANSGQGSIETANIAQNIFDKIFEPTYGILSSKKGFINFAKKYRYAKHNIDKELEDFIKI